jgi:serine/threonine protein kinase
MANATAPDDLLGVFGDPAVIGKRLGQDLREGKQTWLLLRARLAEPAARELIERSVGQSSLRLPVRQRCAGQASRSSQAGHQPRDLVGDCPGLDGSGDRRPGRHEDAPPPPEERVMAGPDLTMDTVLAGYRILEPIGRGGMGVVYRAEDVALERLVALKVLAPGLAGQEEFRRRFLREMRIAASIEHPNILPIYRAGEDRDLLYLAMRYVDAQDLRAVLRHGPLEPRRAVEIVDQIAQALDAAHARGLVHRDVKPANVLLTAPGTGGREHAYLVDFGVARPTAVDGSITSGDMIVGTLAYAAPEQLTGGVVDARSDVYALGCVLHECLAGRPPFTAETNQALIFAHLQAPPPSVRSARPGLPPAIDAVLARALAKDPAARFPSCGELAAAARQAIERGIPPAPARAARPAAAGPLPPAPPLPPNRFQPLLPAADRARKLLWLTVAVALAGVVANLNDTAAFRSLSGEPPGPDAPSALANGVFAVEGIVLLLTALLFLLWFRRAYWNLLALGAGRLRYTGGWATWGWLVPLLSLVRPKQLLNDLWRASDPALPPGQPDAWRRRPVPSVLTWWWLVFLASVAARAVTTESFHALAQVMTFGLLGRVIDLIRPTSGVQALADLLTAVAALLALRVVRMLTDRQQARAERLGNAPHGPPR